MSAEWIRERYGVPAKKGARIRYTSFLGLVEEGVITSCKGGYIHVQFDGREGPSVLHPTWRVEYLEAT